MDGTWAPENRTVGEPEVHRSPEDLATAVRDLRATGRRIAFVPTMGALHAGHRELIRQARRAGGDTAAVVSIFVNPLQFGAGEDLSRYPRPLEADLDACRDEGVELVFLPGVADMYPEGADTTVVPGPLGAQLEGAVRPGHFAGVLTVVAKLFHIVAPDLAYFGEKDYQQLALITRMVRDLNFPLSVVPVPTVREPDGLALSSRNVYLTPAERSRATRLFRALTAGAVAAADGPAAVLDAARAVLERDGGLPVDYLELRGAALDVTPGPGPARLLVAARLGTTHLIDNVGLHL
ncbi:pantoate--beta-alanine ligase [Pseudonocardia sp. KRD291]|uniref:pantoate--beta-alanine ligase n=1 Tax=Pseudonocardia sp. KRD291 TaxID=2792007 RepID=UPI0027E3538A|nr:pantoate--beta-alanine ligase [Pseudonocardia sp. KRD291]